MTNKLTTREKLEITAETALQLIPYVGSALSTAYFSTKQEKDLYVLNHSIVNYPIKYQV